MPSYSDEDLRRLAQAVSGVSYTSAVRDLSSPTQQGLADVSGDAPQTDVEALLSYAADVLAANPDWPYALLKRRTSSLASDLRDSEDVFDRLIPAVRAYAPAVPDDLRQAVDDAKRDIEAALRDRVYNPTKVSWSISRLLRSLGRHPTKVRTGSTDAVDSFVRQVENAWDTIRSDAAALKEWISRQSDGGIDAAPLDAYRKLRVSYRLLDTLLRYLQDGKLWESWPLASALSQAVSYSAPVAPDDARDQVSSSAPVEITPAELRSIQFPCSSPPNLIFLKVTADGSETTYTVTLSDPEPAEIYTAAGEEVGGSYYFYFHDNQAAKITGLKGSFTISSPEDWALYVDGDRYIVNVPDDTYDVPGSGSTDIVPILRSARANGTGALITDVLYIYRDGSNNILFVHKSNGYHNIKGDNSTGVNVGKAVGTLDSSGNPRDTDDEHDSYTVKGANLDRKLVLEVDWTSTLTIYFPVGTKTASDVASWINSTYTSIGAEALTDGRIRIYTTTQSDNSKLRVLETCPAIGLYAGAGSRGHSYHTHHFVSDVKKVSALHGLVEAEASMPVYYQGMAEVVATDTLQLSSVDGLQNGHVVFIQSGSPVGLFRRIDTVTSGTNQIILDDDLPLVSAGDQLRVFISDPRVVLRGADTVQKLDELYHLMFPEAADATSSVWQLDVTNELLWTRVGDQLAGSTITSILSGDTVRLAQPVPVLDAPTGDISSGDRELFQQLRQRASGWHIPTVNWQWLFSQLAIYGNMEIKEEIITYLNQAKTLAGQMASDLEDYSNGVRSLPAVDNLVDELERQGFYSLVADLEQWDLTAFDSLGEGLATDATKTRGAAADVVSQLQVPTDVSYEELTEFPADLGPEGSSVLPSFTSSSDDDLVDDEEWEEEPEPWQ